MALRICVIYALISSLWIFFSDQWIFTFFSERSDIALISMIKGVIFVLVTSLVICFLVDRGLRAVRQSEESYRTLIETSPDAIALLDLDTRIIMVNRQALALSGYDSAEDLLGRNILDLIASRDRESVSARVRVLLQSGAPCSAEYTAVRKNGGLFPVESSASLILDQDRKPKSIMVIMRDFTERDQAEREIRLLAQTVASTRDCVSITDLEDKILFVNDAFIETYGYTREELIGKQVSVVRSPLSLQEVNKQIRPATLNGSWYGEVLNRRKDGSDFPVELWTSVVKNDEDEPVAMVGVARDITERKLVEQALRRSEMKFRRLVEQAADGVFTADPDGRILLVNPKACEMLGYTEEELLGLNIRDTYPPEDIEVAGARMREAEVDRPLQFERAMRRKDGSYFPVEISLQLLKDGTFQGIVRDISARQQAEGSLRRLYTAIEQSDEVIFMTELDGVITYVNPAFEKVYGFKKQEVLGKTPRVLKSGMLDENEYPEFWRRLLSGESVHRELINKTKDGRLVTMESSANPVVDAAGAIMGFIAVQNDITDRKRMEEERKMLESQLFQAQKMESIGTLAGGIAHDFNNILAIILGHATLLEHVSDDPGKFLKSRESIVTAVQRGANLVQQILTIARKTDVIFEHINVNDTIIELVKMLEGTFPKSINLSAQLSPSIPFIEADRNRVHQALLNLCVNARDAMPEGGSLAISTQRANGARLRARFPDARESEFICVCVTDTGTGMHEATKQRLFEPFFTTKPTGKGTGLGLAVVHGIMKSHGGHIDVETGLGKGTSFRLYFPVPHINHDAVECMKEVPGDVLGGNETILLVEDEEALRDLVRALLRGKGYRVLTAGDGEEAVRIFKEHRREIDVVLSDIGLPKSDGLSVLRQMKAISPDVKVVLVSGYLEPEMKVDIQKAGAKGIVMKPYIPHEILKRIRDVIDEA